MPHRVLHLLGTAQPAGTSIARIVANLAHCHDPARYTLDAWFLEGDGPLAGLVKDAGAGVRVFDLRGWNGAEDAWRFSRALRRENYAIIHLHYWARRLRWLLRATARAKLVLHLHSHVAERRSLEPVRIDTRGADLVIATSQAVANYAQGSRPHVVHPGLLIPDEAEAGPALRPGTTLGTAGRLVPMKGLAHLIRALALVRERVPAARLEIAGTGPEQTALETEARALGVLDAVTFLGWRDDLPRVYRNWDVFVQSSIIEPFGMAALEAMAAGLPVVATAVGGLPELIEDGRTGRLVPPTDAGLLADCIVELLQNPEQRKTLGAAGRARARNKFSAQAMAAAVSRLYDGLLAAGSPADPGVS
jgi:glycosyltransferase involved in cell wall biosynthesis